MQRQLCAGVRTMRAAAGTELTDVANSYLDLLQWGATMDGVAVGDAAERD